MTCRSNLAYVFRSAGDPGRAVLYEQTLTDRTPALGEDHPDEPPLPLKSVDELRAQVLPRPVRTGAPAGVGLVSGLRRVRSRRSCSTFLSPRGPSTYRGARSGFAAPSTP
ncbi:tetratricopeptide repeat protein [Streptomyces sp. NPDC018833]|uniref:tetratricopeptide repeat protein n=1 Tax=Streptomyces sp. NPDC018833 TaxID=3365053 RepID=UPI003790AA93